MGEMIIGGICAVLGLVLTAVNLLISMGVPGIIGGACCCICGAIMFFRGREKVRMAKINQLGDE